jgi:hypothetical protein
MGDPMPVNGNGNGNGRGEYEEWRYRDVKGDIEELKVWTRAELGTISTKLDAIKDGGKQDPKMWIGLLIGAVTVIYLIIDKEATIVSGPLASDLKVAQRDLERFGTWQQDADHALQLNAAIDAESRKDRDDTRQRLDRMQDQIGKLGGDILTDKSALAEVETQFKADELVASQRESNTEQWKGMFYRRLYGEPLPQRGPVVPGIARAPRDGG